MHGDTPNPVLIGILIRPQFTILRFEDSQDSSIVAVAEDDQAPIAGYQRYSATFPARADVGTYQVIVSEGQAEKYSFNSDLVINRNNLAEDVQNSLSGGTVPSEPTGTAAHRRFVNDLSFSLVEADAWGVVRNHPNFRPYNFHRLAAGFWGEDQTGTVTNYFDDVTGVTYSLALTGGSTSAHFGASTSWAGYPSYFSNTLTLSNATTGNHGGAELGTGDFAAWYTTISMFPSVGLTRIANAGPANVLTNFNTDKRFALSLGGTNVIAFMEFNTANNRLALTTMSDVGNLTLYKNGIAIGAAIIPTSSTRAINSTATGNFQYLWTTAFDESDLLAFSSSNSSFRMLLVNNQNTVRFGNFGRLAGGPFDNNYRRAGGFDYRLPDTTGISNLLTIGNDPTTITFGGSSTVPRQMLIGYDELGTFVLTGAADGGVTTAEQLTFFHKSTQTIPHMICTIEATGSAGDSPITNNCNFNISPATGAVNLKLFIHFVNNSLSVPEQGLPVSILDRTVTIGSNSPSSGQTLTIPWQKNNAYSFDTQTFSVMSSFTGSSNTLAISTSADLETFLRANDSTVSLNISVASEQSANRALNNDLSIRRIWPSLSAGQTQELVFWVHPEDDQSPNESDPFLAVSGSVNGTNFGIPLNRRASEFDFSNMKFGNDAAVMAHLQVYSYEYVQNQLTNIWSPNVGNSFASNLYQQRNAWFGLWSHPDEDVGEFTVNDDLVAPNLVENSVPGRVSIEGCRFNSNGTLRSSSCNWVVSSRRAGQGKYRVNFSVGYFSLPPTCVTVGTDAGAGSCEFDDASVSTSGINIDCVLPNVSQRDLAFNLICIGER